MSFQSPNVGALSLNRSPIFNKMDGKVQQLKDTKRDQTTMTSRRFAESVVGQSKSNQAFLAIVTSGIGGDTESAITLLTPSQKVDPSKALTLMLHRWLLYLDISLSFFNKVSSEVMNLYRTSYAAHAELSSEWLTIMEDKRKKASNDILTAAASSNVKQARDDRGSLLQTRIAAFDM